MRIITIFAVMCLLLATSSVTSQASDLGVSDADLNGRIDLLKTKRLALEADNKERADKAKALREERIKKRIADTGKVKGDIASNETALKAAEEIIRIHTTECDVVKARHAGKNPGDTTEHDRLLADASRTRQECLGKMGTLQTALILVGGELPSAEESKLAMDMRADESKITALTGELGRLKLELDLKPSMRPPLSPLSASDFPRATSNDVSARGSTKADRATNSSNRENESNSNDFPVVSKVGKTVSSPSGSTGASGDTNRADQATEKHSEPAPKSEEKDLYVGTFATDRYVLKLSPSPNGNGYTGTFKVGDTERQAWAVWRSGQLILLVNKADGTKLEMPLIQKSGEGITLGEKGNTISFGRKQPN